MYQLAFLIWLEVVYLDMSSECDDTPDCRAFFITDQRSSIARWDQPRNHNGEAGLF